MSRRTRLKFANRGAWSAAMQKRKMGKKEKKDVIAINHLARQALNIPAEDFLTLGTSQSEARIRRQPRNVGQSHRVAR